MFNPISDQDKVDFAKNLSIMLKSGIPIDESLGTLSTQVRSKFFGKLIAKVKNDVEYGTTLSAAFAKEDRHFGKTFTSLVQAGEVSGTLEENLTFLSDWLERNHDLKSDIKAATFYPKMVISATFILGMVLSIYILPKLTPMFSQLNVELPWTTKLMLAFANYVQTSWYIFIAEMVTLIVAVMFLNRVKAVRRFWHALFLRMPIVGGLYREYQLAIVSQLMSTLVRGGLPIAEALQATEEAVTNLSYQDAIRKARWKVSRGTPMSEALGEYPRLFPKNFLNIIAVGEKSGTLENSLGYMAEFYNKEVATKTKKLPALIEPILLVFIALGVLFVAVSVLMPIYSLTSGISR